MTELVKSRSADPLPALPDFVELDDRHFDLGLCVQGAEAVDEPS